MDLNLSLRNKEVSLKLLTKVFGVAKILLMYRLTGYGKDLDNFFLLQSFLGIVLLVNIFIELNYPKELSYLNKDFTERLVGTLLVLISLYLAVVVSYTGYNESSSPTYITTVILALSVPFNVFNYVQLFKSRFTTGFGTAVYAYLVISIANLFFYLLCYSFLSSKLVALGLTVLLSEFTISILFFRKEIRVFFSIKRLRFLVISKQAAISLVIIFGLMAFDVIDKLFLIQMNPGLVSVYHFALYPSVILRSILDLRSSFNAELVKNKTGHLESFINYSSYVFKRIAIIALTTFLIYLIARNPLIDLLIALNLLTQEYAKSYALVALLAVVLYLPIQLYFDLIYRLIYVSDSVGKFVFYVPLFLIVNIFGNYFFGVYLGLDIIGVIISTITTFLGLVLVSRKLVL